MKMEEQGHPFGWVYVEGHELAFEKLTRVMKPRAHTIINNNHYAMRLKTNASPETMYYIRHWSPDDVDEKHWERYSPKDYVQKFSQNTYGGVLGLQLLNEPGWGVKQAEWLNETIKECAAIGQPASFGGWQPGVYPATAEEWGAHPAFEQLAWHACFTPGMVLDVHARYAILWVQGMVPKNLPPGVEYSNMYFIKHMFKRETWPNSPDDLAAMYMVGRIKGLFDFCWTKWKAKPRVRKGEFGPDNMVDSSQNPDFETWLKSQPSSNPLVSYPRGWRSCFDVWRQLFFPGEEPEMVNAIQGKAAWERILDPIGVWALNWFILGNGGKGIPDPSRNWNDHDYGESTRSQEIFMSLPVGKIPPPPAPKPTPPKKGEYTIETAVGLNLREAAGEDQTILVELKDKQEVTVLSDDVVTVGKYDWVQAEAYVLEDGEEKHYVGHCAVLGTTRWVPIPDPQPVPSQLTLDERDVLNTLAAAWDKFLTLPDQHPDHQGEFRTLIHHAQRMIMSRPIARTENWTK
jgi:hypothetical protein